MTSNPTPSVRIRKANQEDVGFIFNSWLKSFKSSFWAKNITNTIYYAEHHKILERLLKSNETYVACDQSDPSQIFGYINAGKVEGILCVNYIYVKQPFRNLGIGKVLLNCFEHNPDTAAVFTHATHMSNKLAAKYNMVYHPYLLHPQEVESDSKE